MYAMIFALTIRAYFWPQGSIVLLSIITTLVFTAINLWGMFEAVKLITIVNLGELAVLVAAVIRGKEFVVPRGDTRIEVADRVVFVGPTAAVKAARDVIQLKK